MSWIRGTVTSYLDLSDKIVAAATGNSISTVDSISAGGSGYAVGEIITFTGGTFTVATQLEVTSVSGGSVTGVRIYNAGAYTVNPSDSNATTSSGSGTGATFTHTYASTGWTADRNTTWSGSEKEVIMHGSGGGSDVIYVGWRTFSGSGYYNFELHGMTGYDSALSHSEQPGISPGFHDAASAQQPGCYLLSSNGSMSYWFNINAYRIIGVVKTGTAYFNFYLGFGNRFGTTTEYPYPMCVSGHTSDPFALYNQTQLSSGLSDPWHDDSYTSAGAMMILDLNNAWVQVTNGQSSATGRLQQRDVVVVPAQNPNGNASGGAPQEDRFADATTLSIVFGDFITQSGIGTPTYNFVPTDGTNDGWVIFPCIIVMSSPSYQIFMELDEVYWVGAYGPTSLNNEDRIIGSDVFRVFQNCNRTDSHSFLAIKEA